MIYTVTLNPAVDYIMHTAALDPAGLNRSDREEYYAGGKGINVSLVLKQLSVESSALGFVAGFTGQVIKQKLAESGIREDFITLENGFTRINVKIKGETESEINGSGPDIPPESIRELKEKLSCAVPGDIIVLSGSVPGCLGSGVYSGIVKEASERCVKTVVDASGSALAECLEYQPFLIKPNHHELGELFGCDVNDKKTATVLAAKLQSRGAKNVLVSMAEKGCVLLDENGETHCCDAADGKLVNSVGAGDSAVAGFIAGYLANDGFEKALLLSVAAGGATAFSPGLASGDDIKILYKKLLQKLRNA